MEKLNISDEQAKEAWTGVKKRWSNRLRETGYQGAEQAREQAIFFSGAMAAMLSIGMTDGQAMPSSIVIPCLMGTDVMTGDSIMGTDEEQAPSDSAVCDVYDQIPEDVRDRVLREMVENWPEASCETPCIRWDYKALRFVFDDTDQNVTVLEPHLQQAFRQLLAEGCYPELPGDLSDVEQWTDWLCQCDADQFTALAEYAVQAVYEEEQ